MRAGGLAGDIGATPPFRNVIEAKKPPHFEKTRGREGGSDMALYKANRAHRLDTETGPPCDFASNPMIYFPDILRKSRKAIRHRVGPPFRKIIAANRRADFG